MDVLVLILSEIANTVKIPMYYYHIPSQTGYNYKMKDLLAKSRDSIPTFAGIKYVSTDLEDFAAISQVCPRIYKYI